MKFVEITQYMRPSGRPVKQSLSVDDELHALCTKIIDAGFYFEAEVLPDGTVSMTITDDDDDHEIELMENGPNVVKGFSKMVRRFVEEQNIT